jgi:hypothetical protein
VNVDEIVQTAVPVLCVDTCAVLDLMRDPTREAALPRIRKAGLDLVDLAEQGRLAMLLADQVALEFAANEADVGAEARRALRKLRQQVERIDELAAVYGAQGAAEMGHLDDHVDRARAVVGRLMDVAIGVTPSNDIPGRAMVRVIAHSFAGDGWRAVLDDLFERGLVDGGGRLAVAGVVSAATAASARERRATAQGLWAEGRPIAGTLSETHLRRRGVESASAALRHHPGVPAAVYAARGFRRPALLAAIMAPAGELTGVEVTYLAPNGDRARMALARKTIGVRAPGSAVRLDPPAPRMLVGEGVATCLSAAARFGLPAWALLSTGNLRAWRPPPGVEFVVIAADRGRDGERSALVLARALRALGVRGAVRWPPAPFGDWNEAWVAIREGK